VALHGGSIDARNLEGDGLVVTVILPGIAREHTQEHPAVAADASGGQQAAQTQ
jgi:hypothetical protein